jgi:hypothetical protein
MPAKKTPWAVQKAALVTTKPVRNVEFCGPRRFPLEA